MWPNTNYETHLNKSQRHIHVTKKGEVENFGPVLLEEVEVAIHKYGSSLHFFKSCEEKGMPQTRAHSPFLTALG